MALNISETEREKLFRQVKHRLGAPIRKIELEDEMLSTLLEISIEDYSSYINEWLIESQWTSLYGKDLTITDLTKALTVREMSYEDSFTYAYSKIVGLQARGPWELKHDYVTIEKGKQAYVIPAGREINEVLWITPPTIDNALFGAYGVGGDLGFGGGFAQMPFGGAGGGAGFGAGFFLGSSYDILSRDADFDLKQRIISGDLIYKITAGEKGTKILHLIPPPGSRIMFGGLAGSKGIDVDGSRVWYHYYDVADEDERGRCLNANKDIIKLPSDVPVDVVDFDELNTPSKQWVRDYFTAMCKETLGRVRGKFGGSLGVTDADVTMDFDSLLNESKEDKEKLWERLSLRLERLRPDKMLERKALEAENLNKSLQYRPLGHNWNVI
ncbi:hypothetical protein N9966_00500 [bacterium]|jgi:hypothetical protein|nr:hypothetical protein [bacterium]